MAATRIGLEQPFLLALIVFIRAYPIFILIASANLALIYSPQENCFSLLNLSSRTASQKKMKLLELPNFFLDCPPYVRH